MVRGHKCMWGEMFRQLCRKTVEAQRQISAAEKLIHYSNKISRFVILIVGQSIVTGE